jgi:hypothetical protein
MSRFLLSVLVVGAAIIFCAQVLVADEDTQLALAALALAIGFYFCVEAVRPKMVDPNLPEPPPLRKRAARAVNTRPPTQTS